MQMQTLLSLVMGYFIGSLNPAKFVAKRHDVNLKETGTGNLGATNTALVLGRKAGYFVLAFDMFKSFFSYKLAKIFFPHLAAAGVIACIGVIIGHAFPIFNGFQGGKGLASFGGLVLAHDPLQFASLLMLGIVMVIAFIAQYPFVSTRFYSTFQFQLPYTVQYFPMALAGIFMALKTLEQIVERILMLCGKLPKE